MVANEKNCPYSIIKVKHTVVGKGICLNNHHIVAKDNILVKIRLWKKASARGEPVGKAISLLNRVDRVKNRLNPNLFPFNNIHSLVEVGNTVACVVRKHLV